MATENQRRIANLADCLFSLKLSNSAMRGLEGGVAQLLNNCRDASLSIERPNNVEPFDDNLTEEDAGSIQLIRDMSNEVLEVSDDVANFISRATENGFIPPSNPFAELMEFNNTRYIHSLPGNAGNNIFPRYLEPQLSDDIMFNIKIFLGLLKKEKEGKLDLVGKQSTTSAGSAQISSYNLSLSGYDIATTGEGSDILSFLPNADLIKRRRVRKSLGALNFANREPQIIFTANYDPEGISRGCIVGWIKIPDASGYTIRRKELFSGNEKKIKIANTSLESIKDSVSDYVKEWVLSFYDIDIDRIYLYLDETIKRDNIYTYNVSAFQTIRTDNNFAFEVDYTPFVLSSIQLKDIRSEISAHVANTLGKKFTSATADDISPYPFLSKKLYGNDKFDWILAAANVKLSKDRGDEKKTVRSFSYLGSNLAFIESQISNNNFFKPVDPNKVVKNISDSIQTYGLSQTIIEIIELVGLNMFFGGKESPEEETFKRATSILGAEQLDEIDAILNSIDVETATVDVSVLVSNLLNMQQGKANDGSVDETVTANEIPVSGGDDNVIADDPLQFVTKFDPGEEILDLATFEGISDFIRIVRLFFDMIPNRFSFEPANYESPKKVITGSPQVSAAELLGADTNTGETNG